MMLVPYLVCCRNRAHASIDHSVALCLCAGVLLIDLLATLVHLNFPFKTGDLFASQ